MHGAEQISESKTDRWLSTQALRGEVSHVRLWATQVGCVAYLSFSSNILGGAGWAASSAHDEITDLWAS
jgi:hypothetical protein